ncbi:MAG: 50S ribosomal protein L3 [Pseudomonadota bacterium]|nr:50S ribosomal protein L3 [Pseudomonadota bacterium]
MIGIVGKKVGMTRCFTEDGASVPVTVILAVPNRITQVKTIENDGYRSIQVAAGTKRANLVNKSKAGTFAKAGVEPGDSLCEFRLADNDSVEYKVGDELNVEVFSAGQVVDVRSKSKGKGYAGVVKRWNFGTQPMSHGNSLSHRSPGSIGQNQTPGRVFKGKKMAGRMGGKPVTVQGQKIFRVDLEKNVIFVKGTVPGAPGTTVVILPSVKAKQKEAN